MRSAAYTFKVRQMRIDQNAQVAWNAAYWMLRSEARRQINAQFPDCNWDLVEDHDECVAAVIEAQTRLCARAMQGPNSSDQQFA